MTSQTYRSQTDNIDAETGMDDNTEPRAAADSELPDGYRRRDYGIDLNLPVAPGGYLWWYIDALSADGAQAITLIVFVGSVFSPYYARARRRGAAPAENHCAFNAILYGPGSRKRWSMTERSQRRLERSAQHLQIGPSSLSWDGRELVADIDEHCTPLPYRMRGRITVRPQPLTQHSLCLDGAGRHFWHPLAPLAEVEVDMPSRGVHWRGEGYLDSNEGSEPLEAGFRDWDWSRARSPEGDCQVLYHTRTRGDAERRLAMRFSEDGSLRAEPAPALQTLATTPVWRVPRHTLATASSAAHIARTLEDTPFYARSLVATSEGGERVLAVHESLSLSRFEQRWVQTLLPFRMPRIG
jgi:carotenoid 1,2-hydratase